MLDLIDYFIKNAAANAKAIGASPLLAQVPWVLPAGGESADTVKATRATEMTAVTAEIGIFTRNHVRLATLKGK